MTPTTRRSVVAAVLLAACSHGRDDPREPDVFAGEGITFAIPAGYDDSTREVTQADPMRVLVVLTAKDRRNGYQPTIVFQRAPLPGGTLADSALCADTASSIANGVGGTVTAASIINGPVGRTCQMRIVAPDGVALITELNRPGETWLMTCNHAAEDAESERVCLSTLASFRFGN